MDDKTLYTNIKKRRKELDMSQDTLARLSGYANRSAIARIESGEIDLPQSKIKAIADALRTTPGDLIGWNVEEMELSSEEADIVRSMRKNEKLREHVLMYCKLFKEMNKDGES